MIADDMLLTYSLVLVVCSAVAAVGCALEIIITKRKNRK